MESEKILPKLAFNLLEDAEASYNTNKHFTDETMENLHTIFGNVFFEACYFLESYNFKLIEYQTEDCARSIFRVSNHNEQFTVYKDLNFCYCPTFKSKVLDLQEYLTCKHVLALRLARIMGKSSVETVKSDQFVEFLNQQLNYLDNTV